MSGCAVPTATAHLYQIQPKPTAVDGNFWKFIVAPTFKLDVGDLLTRPELRVFASFMNWSSDLDKYTTSDTFGRTDFKAGGVWQYGVQMETWF